jgi:hypothetical protein
VRHILIAVFLLILGVTSRCLGSATTMTLESVIGQMKPYEGRHVPGIDPSTLSGKVICGYQGWFSAPGDGAGLGWSHYAWNPQEFRTDRCVFDLWPDMAEMDDDERYPTPYKNKDGSHASVFSSSNRKTVLRHFRWMKEYGIDGVFLQRFGVQLKNARELNHRNVVLSSVQAGANEFGRIWALMYDLTDLQPGEIEKFVIEDWKNLKDRMNITQDKSYLHHKGKPVVAVWGIGFDDNRPYSLDECGKLIQFLKKDPKYGGNTVMVGIPTWWRDLKWDAVQDRKLHELILQADIVSPWMVGRYDSPEAAAKHVNDYVKQDIAWCKTNGKDYLPVVFPGFSWQNLKRCYGEDAPLDAIPRLKGRFLWTQAIGHIRAGADMIYIAMFDEINEATAIFKCSNDPPAAECKFMTYKGLRSDYYLWLTGKIARLLRKEIPLTDNPPQRTD